MVCHRFSSSATQKRCTRGCAARRARAARAVVEARLCKPRAGAIKGPPSVQTINSFRSGCLCGAAPQRASSVAERYQ